LKGAPLRQALALLANIRLGCARSKHSRLFGFVISDEEKRFIKLTLDVNIIKYILFDI